MAGGIELADMVGQEQDLARLRVDRRCDYMVGCLVELAADPRIEEAGEERREIAMRRMSEDQALRLHRAGRIDVESDAGLMPAAQAGCGVGIDVADQFASGKTVLPDQSLQGLQRR